MYIICVWCWDKRGLYSRYLRLFGLIFILMNYVYEVIFYFNLISMFFLTGVSLQWSLQEMRGGKYIVDNSFYLAHVVVSPSIASIITIVAPSALIIVTEHNSFLYLSPLFCSSHAWWSRRAMLTWTTPTRRPCRYTHCHCDVNFSICVLTSRCCMHSITYYWVCFQWHAISNCHFDFSCRLSAWLRPRASTETLLWRRTWSGSRLCCLVRNCSVYDSLFVCCFRWLKDYEFYDKWVIYNWLPTWHVDTPVSMRVVIVMYCMCILLCMWAQGLWILW